MNRESLLSTIAAVDAATPKEGARVWIGPCGDGLDECKLLANEAGYLRLGIELLKAGVGPCDDRQRVDVDLEYLFEPDSPLELSSFERREFELPPRVEPALGRFGPLLAAGLMIGVLVLALVGLVTVIGWVMH